MTVLDASALLAFLNDEPGRDPVGRALAAGDCRISAANWSEIWQKARQHSLPQSALHALASLVEVVPVDRAQAEQAAELWSTASTLSLADRMCLALVVGSDEPALTADREWSSVDNANVVMIR